MLVLRGMLVCLVTASLGITMYATLHVLAGLRITEAGPLARTIPSRPASDHTTTTTSTRRSIDLDLTTRPQSQLMDTISPPHRLPEAWKLAIEAAVDSMWETTNGLIKLANISTPNANTSELQADFVQFVGGRIYIAPATSHNNESDAKPLSNIPLWRRQRIYHHLLMLWIAQKQGINLANFEMWVSGADCTCDWTYCFSAVHCDFHPTRPYLNLPYVQWYEERDGRWEDADSRLKEYIAFGRNLTWSQRASKAVFRGTMNHMTTARHLPGGQFSMSLTPKTWQVLGRGKLLSLRTATTTTGPYNGVAIDGGDYLDVHLIGTVSSLARIGILNWTAQVAKQGLVQDQPPGLSMKDQARWFKYGVYAEGACGWADRLKWMLALGLVPLMQDTKCIEWYTLMLKPWVHYIPVDGFFNNLTAAIEWARTNDDAVYRMSLAGMEFAENVLSQQGMLYYTERLIRSYIERLHEDNQPKVPRTDAQPWEP